jgi:hypothetical protein
VFNFKNPTVKGKFDDPGGRPSTAPYKDDNKSLKGQGSAKRLPSPIVKGRDIDLK